MFNRQKNRAIQVSMVKTAKTDKNLPEPTQGCSHKDPQQIAEIAKDFVTHTAKAVGAVIIVAAFSTAITRMADNLTKNDDHS